MSKSAFLVLAVLASIASGAFAQSGSLGGTATVVDGDTIDISGQRVRLHGIDAPEIHQGCLLPSGQAYRCGEDAKVVLETIIGGARVACQVLDKDQYQRSIGRCFADQLDIGEEMVKRGFALAYRRYSTDYVLVEIDARNQGAGIWSSRFTPPWDFRAGRRLQVTGSNLPTQNDTQPNDHDQESGINGLVTAASALAALDPSFGTLAMVLGVVSKLPVENTTQRQTQQEVRVPPTIADFGALILSCFHHTGRFYSVDVAQRPWEREHQYGAEDSAILRIRWFGKVMNNQYELFVATLSRPGAIRVIPIAHNSFFPPSQNCALNDWTPAILPVDTD
jgi:endonuclease YncB( thermonuclease family)